MTETTRIVETEYVPMTRFVADGSIIMPANDAWQWLLCGSLFDAVGYAFIGEPLPVFSAMLCLYGLVTYRKIINDFIHSQCVREVTTEQTPEPPPMLTVNTSGETRQIPAVVADTVLGNGFTLTDVQVGKLEALRAEKETISGADFERGFFAGSVTDARNKYKEMRRALLADGYIEDRGGNRYVWTNKEF